MDFSTFGLFWSLFDFSGLFDFSLFWSLFDFSGLFDFWTFLVTFRLFGTFRLLDFSTFGLFWSLFDFSGLFDFSFFWLPFDFSGLFDFSGGTFRLFVFRDTFQLFGTFRLFGTFQLFVFLVTFRLFGTFRLRFSGCSLLFRDFSTFRDFSSFRLFVFLVTFRNFSTFRVFLVILRLCPCTGARDHSSWRLLSVLIDALLHRCIHLQNVHSSAWKPPDVPVSIMEQMDPHLAYTESCSDICRLA